MCMIEIADTVAVNKKFARITNASTALYFAELLTILKEVKRKNKYDPETRFWKLDRKYMRDETGLDSAEQKNCESILAKLEILQTDENNADRLRVSVKRYFEVLAEEEVDETKISKTAKMTAAEKKAAKRNSIIDILVKMFGELDDAATEAVKRLVETYYDRGVCTKAAWQPRVDLVKAFAKDSAAVKDIADYMVATGWSSFPDMIDSFVKKHTATRLNTEQKKNTGTMADVEF